jgi:hypothetical protein
LSEVDRAVLDGEEAGFARIHIPFSISSRVSLSDPLFLACSCRAERDLGVSTMARKKSSTPKMMAFASPFFVTKNRSLFLEARSRICPNWVRAINAGTFFVITQPFFFGMTPVL